MLVLASSSPRRKELLAQAGYQFTILPANIPEERHLSEEPIAFVARLAEEKAQCVFDQLHRDSPPDSFGEPLLVLGADTIVVTSDEILGKPRDEADAARMLRLLSGCTHQVITGVCLISSLISRQKTEVAVERTAVTMGEISVEEISRYIATGEPMDKAGAYAIQGYAARWIPRIEGCYFNVVGLPLARTARMIETMSRNQDSEYRVLRPQSGISVEA